LHGVLHCWTCKRYCRLFFRTAISLIIEYETIPLSEGIFAILCWLKSVYRPVKNAPPKNGKIANSKIWILAEFFFLLKKHRLKRFRAFFNMLEISEKFLIFIPTHSISEKYPSRQGIF
jgi:hypothetical protein